MTVAARINTSRWNTLRWNGRAMGDTVTDLMYLIWNQPDITNRWTAVPGATAYRVQTSLYQDFRTTFDDQFVNEPVVQFTDSQANDAKRFWRWRPTTNMGASYMQPWSEVASYWMDVNAVEQVKIAKNTWALVAPDEVTDRYEFEMFPRYSTLDQNLYRIRERNRLGEMLTEFLTIKGQITMWFNGGQFLGSDQFNEMLRFHNAIRTVFLLGYLEGEGGDFTTHVWKVVFSQDPNFTMMTAGRQDLLTGQLNFEEV